MTTSVMTAEVAVLGIAMGIVLALVCHLTTNLSPGGMVTPGWLAVTLVENPVLVLVIGVLVLATWGAAVLLQRAVILFGKRLFAGVVTLGVLFQMSFALLTGGEQSLVVTHQTLAYIVPGLMAYQMLRQPAWPTAAATAGVSTLVYGVLAVGISLNLLAV